MKEVQLEQYQLVGRQVNVGEATPMKSTMTLVKEEIIWGPQSNLDLIRNKLGKTTACKPPKSKIYLHILMHKQFKLFLHNSQRRAQ